MSGSKTKKEVNQLLLAMLILHRSAKEETQRKKIVEGLCQLAFWVWGWNVQTFHEQFTKLAKDVGGTSVTYRFDARAGLELELDED